MTSASRSGPELSARELAELAFEDFGGNRGQDLGPAVRELMDPDVEIVPLRAALEGTVYRGASAVDEFLKDVRESWSSIRFDIEKIRDVSPDSVLVVATMHSTGRETGAEVDRRATWIVSARAGKITRAAVYSTEEAALDSVNPSSGAQS